MKKYIFLAVVLFIWSLGAAAASEMDVPIKQLTSGDPATRVTAARELGKSQDPRAVEPLINALRNDKNWDVRAAAEDALVSIGEPAVKPLIALLDNEDWHIRRRAARTLGEIHNPSSDEALAVVLKKDKDCCVRKFSAKALGETRDPRAVEILMVALREKNMDVVAGAYCFFISRGEPGTEVILIEVLNQNVNKKMIMDFLNSGNSQLSQAAFERAKSRGYSVSATSDWQGPRWGAM